MAEETEGSAKQAVGSAPSAQQSPSSESAQTPPPARKTQAPDAPDGSAASPHEAAQQMPRSEASQTPPAQKTQSPDEPGGSAASPHEAVTSSACRAATDQSVSTQNTSVDCKQLPQATAQVAAEEQSDKKEKSKEEKKAEELVWKSKYAQAINLWIVPLTTLLLLVSNFAQLYYTHTILAKYNVQKAVLELTPAIKVDLTAAVQKEESIQVPYRRPRIRSVFVEVTLANLGKYAKEFPLASKDVRFYLCPIEDLDRDGAFDCKNQLNFYISHGSSENKQLVVYGGGIEKLTSIQRVQNPGPYLLYFELIVDKIKIYTEDYPDGKLLESAKDKWSYKATKYIYVEPTEEAK